MTTTDSRGDLQEDLAEIFRSRGALETCIEIDRLLVAAGYDRPPELSWSNWVAALLITGLAAGQ